MIEIVEPGDMSSAHEAAWQYMSRHYGHRGMFSRYLTAVCQVPPRENGRSTIVCIYDAYAPRRLQVIKNDAGEVLRYELSFDMQYWQSPDDDSDSNAIKQGICSGIALRDKLWLGEQCDSDYHAGGFSDIAVINSDFVGDAYGVLQIYPNRRDATTNQFSMLVKASSVSPERAQELKSRLHKSYGKPGKPARFVAFCSLLKIYDDCEVVVQVFDRRRLKTLCYFDYGVEQCYFQTPAWELCFKDCAYTADGVLAALSPKLSLLSHKYTPDNLELVFRDEDQRFSPYNQCRLTVSI